MKVAKFNFHIDLHFENVTFCNCHIALQKNYKNVKLFFKLIFNKIEKIHKTFRDKFFTDKNALVIITLSQKKRYLFGINYAKS